MNWPVPSSTPRLALRESQSTSGTIKGVGLFPSDRSAGAANNFINSGIKVNSLLERKIEKRPDKVRLHGRILFLTEDPALIKKQLAGWDMPWDTTNPAANPKLRDDISTDEITPAHYCFYFDQTLGEIPYLGLKCGDVTPIGRSDVKNGGFVCSVSGKRRGKGSSREQSP